MATHSDKTNESYVERTTPRITYKLVDPAGAPIAGSAITTMVATIVSKSTGLKLSGWDATDIDGDNGNSVDEAGAGTWFLPKSATTKSNETDAHEDFDIIIRFTYGAGREDVHVIITRCRESGE